MEKEEENVKVTAMQSPGCQLLLNLPEECQSLTTVKEPLSERGHILMGSVELLEPSPV